MPNRRQAIIWTNAHPIHWRIYAALGEDELNRLVSRFCFSCELYFERCSCLICDITILQYPCFFVLLFCLKGIFRCGKSSGCHSRYVDNGSACMHLLVYVYTSKRYLSRFTLVDLGWVKPNDRENIRSCGVTIYVSSWDKIHICNMSDYWWVNVCVSMTEVWYNYLFIKAMVKHNPLHLTHNVLIHVSKRGL